jgi:hypothetical protein
MKLTDTQLVLLSAASQREDRGIDVGSNPRRPRPCAPSSPAISRSARWGLSWRISTGAASGPRRDAARTDGSSEASGSGSAPSPICSKNRFYIGEVVYRGEVHRGEPGTARLEPHHLTACHVGPSASGAVEGPFGPAMPRRVNRDAVVHSVRLHPSSSGRHLWFVRCANHSSALEETAPPATRPGVPSPPPGSRTSTCGGSRDRRDSTSGWPGPIGGSAP